MSVFFVLIVFANVSLLQSCDDCFRITVVDDETGRGVPLVELKTVNNIRLYTDSAGVVAFHEPGLMDTTVFFHVKSHGYTFPEDGFGYSGTRLRITRGGSAVLKIHRINIAERLYRVTGAGIYRDSILLGDEPPVQHPVLNGLVFGSDSVVNAVYQNRIYWFWGDTNRPSYPLGNFHVPGATSKLPEEGGLHPDIGVDLNYFLGPDGFARPAAQMPGRGPTWIDGLVTASNQDGQERLLARYVKIEPPLQVYERGIVEFDDEKQRFDNPVRIPMDAPLQPTGHPLKHVADGAEYIYFGHPFPHIRVPATAEDVKSLSAYEAWTCLKDGSTTEAPMLDRTDDGELIYAWRRSTPPVTGKLRQTLIKQQLLRPDEGFIQLQDVNTGRSVAAHGGSVYWNEFRQRWVAIILESFGTSMLGEIWFAEADNPLGPWMYARKIVTHDRYSFYNPKQHPMLDQEDGRTIFFEGTYTNTFSGNPDQTPRYNYNQIMYKLDLLDDRLTVPTPVYDISDSHGNDRQAFLTAGHPASTGHEARAVWYALDQPGVDSIPVALTGSVTGDWRLSPISAAQEDRAQGDVAVAFHALPADIPDAPATAVPLREYIHTDGVTRHYSVSGETVPAGYRETGATICLVWRAPSNVQHLPAAALKPAP